MREWFRRLFFLGRTRRFDADLDAELAFHVEMRARALESEGVPAADAWRRARRDVGRPLQIREAARDAWVFRWLDHLGQDVRFAVRSLTRQPAFAAAVVGTLALGIGANTAIFSVVDALLVRPAPFAHPDRLVLVRAARPQQGQVRLPLSYPNFLDFSVRNHTLDGVAAWTSGDVALTGSGDPEQVQYALVTANLFDVLGVRAGEGRTFRPDENQHGTAPVVIITQGFRQRHFGDDAGVVGRLLRLDGQPHEIIGVLPRGFRFAGYPRTTELWLPFGLDKVQGREYARGASTLGAIGRLRPGRSVEDAQADATGIAGALEREYPDFNRSRQIRVVPLDAQVTSRIRWALMAVSVGVVLVLLVACANVANLLLVRASARQHELALRAVLGGRRRRIVAQLLTEYLVLALAGGAAGLVVAMAARGLLARLPYNTPDYYTPWMPSLEGVPLDGRVLVFTLATSILVGLGVGLLPALAGSASDQAALIAAGTRVSGRRSAMRVRSVLVVAEIALAVVLLTGMGLMLSTMTRLLRVDPGFSADGAVAADVSLPAARYPTAPRLGEFFTDLLDRLRQVPSVTAAGAVEFLPFSGLDAESGLLFEGQPIPTPDKRPRVHYRSVTDGYFEAMGFRMVNGRRLGRDDRSDSARVAVLNETAARQLFPDGHAAARRVSIDFEAMQFFADRPPVFDLALGLREVVGVVGDVRHTGLGDEAVAELFVPASQRPVRRMTVVVRSSLPSAAALAAVRTAVSSIDPNQPLANAAALPDLIAASVSQPRFNTTLLSAFGLLALALAAIGIHGVMSHFVLLRTRDIGIHMAVGASPRDVFRLVTRQMSRLAAAGVAIGLLGAFAAGAGLTRLLFGVSPRDPMVLATVATVVVVTAAAATLVPALRALRIDPARALRAE
jgi:predicted permease